MHGRIVTDFAEQSPPWARVLPDFRELCAAEHPGFRSGMALTLSFADMPTYLGYLHGRLRAGGGQLEIRHVGALTRLLAALRRRRVDRDAGSTRSGKQRRDR
ncbi:hypothetical protein GCM10025778_20530 [Paeniglutamicibacter antarcticus]|uniref:Uncharacterized protein n=1 Tax=Paeniglutamicibacter antarcticus TaxID=494023 RepID=A0ABP9TMY1_9MICC